MDVTATQSYPDTLVSLNRAAVGEVTAAAHEVSTRTKEGVWRCWR